MGKNLLLSKMEEVQTEYKNLLTQLIPSLEGDNRSSALDEIVLFWREKKPIVNIFLRYYAAEHDAYVMTAVTYLDVEAGEQYPFLLTGISHILDDPLGRYCEICFDIEKEGSLPLSSEILKCAKDDLRVLTEYPQILVIPLRLFGEKDKQDVAKLASEQLFLSLFSNISSIEEYCEKIVSVDDIELGIKGFEHSILLYDEDDISLTFSERFRKAKDIFTDWIPDEITDGQYFMCLICGYILQAIDIIISCSDYNIIPYIRYGLSLHYYFLCAEVLEREGKLDCNRKYVSVANVIYKIAEIDRLMSKGDRVFFDAKEDMSFWKKVKEAVEGIALKPGAVNEIAGVIESNLNGKADIGNRGMPAVVCGTIAT